MLNNQESFTRCSAISVCLFARTTLNDLKPLSHASPLIYLCFPSKFIHSLVGIVFVNLSYMGSFTLYLLPIFTVINYHQCNGLKQNKFILLQFWRSESENSLNGLKSRYPRANSFWRLQGRILSLPRLALGLPEFPGLWLYHSNICLCGQIAFSSLTSTLLSSFFMNS